METETISIAVDPIRRIDGDTLKVGPDGHIRHPKDNQLVWWEDSVTGERYWVRQNRWQVHEDIKTQLSPSEPFYNVPSQYAVRLKRQFREDGVRYKVRRRPFTDWNTPEGPWEYDLEMI